MFYHKGKAYNMPGERERDFMTYISSIERHEDVTTSHLHRQLDPFASKLTVYTCMFSSLYSLKGASVVQR